MCKMIWITYLCKPHHVFLHQRTDFIVTSMQVISCGTQESSKSSMKPRWFMLEVWLSSHVEYKPILNFVDCCNSSKLDFMPCLTESQISLHKVKSGLELCCKHEWLCNFSRKILSTLQDPTDPCWIYTVHLCCSSIFLYQKLLVLCPFFFSD